MRYRFSDNLFDSNTRVKIFFLKTIADIAPESDQLDEAERIYTSLLEVGQRRQFRIPLGMVYFGLAYVCLKNGRQDEGLAFACKAWRTCLTSLRPLW